MMCYKDQTFCPGPCSNEECFRHKKHIDDARNGNNKYYLENPCVCWFIEMPQDCKDWIQPHESS